MTETIKRGLHGWLRDAETGDLIREATEHEEDRACSAMADSDGNDDSIVVDGRRVIVSCDGPGDGT